MELGEDEIVGKYDKRGLNCMTNTIKTIRIRRDLFFKSIGRYKRKNWTYKNTTKKNINNRLIHAEKKFICSCIDVNEIYEGGHFSKILETLSRLKDRKLTIKNELVEKC